MNPIPLSNNINFGVDWAGIYISPNVLVFVFE